MGDDLPELVGIGRWTPLTDCEEIQLESARNIVAGRDSDDQLFAVGGNLRNGGREIVDVTRGPDGEVSNGSDGDIDSGAGIEELEGPGGFSGNPEVQFDRVSTGNIEVIAGRSTVEIKDGFVVEYSVSGGSFASDELSIRVRVVLSSFLVGMCERSNSGKGKNGGSRDGSDSSGDGSSGGRYDGVDLSSNISGSSVNFVIGQSICRGHRRAR